MDQLPLFSLAPGLEQSLPRVSLGRFPTPVERSEALSAALGSELYVKRDDLSSELYGGNKVRKLEFLYGEAKARGKTAVLTVGGLGSHHALATALYGKALGFEVGVALFPQPMTPHAIDTLSVLLGAKPRVAVAPAVALVPLAAATLYAELRREHKVGLIPPGGSSALGSVGYVNAALELADQVRAGLLPAPDWVVAPLGSNGTVAGLALGLRLAGLGARVMGVRVVDWIAANPFITMRLVRATARRLRRAGLDTSRLVLPSAVDIVHSEFGRGYGYPTTQAISAQAAAREAGLSLDTTYTAKTLAGIFSQRERLRGKTVVFFNTFSSADLSARPRGSPEELLGARLEALRWDPSRT